MANAKEEEELKGQVFAILKAQGLENMTKKKVRLLVEKERGLELNALKSKKGFISQCIDDYMEQQEKDADASDSRSASPSPPPRKKRKPAPTPTDKPVKKPELIVITRSGSAAPKKLKELQCSAMTAEEFTEIAPKLVVDVFGNKVSGAARVFTSGNKGWYCGGKIEIPLNGQILWGQLGINLSIVGSKTW